MKYLKTIAEECLGCNACMTACSLLYFKADDPEKSAIQVGEAEGGGYTLSACNQCRACVAECPTQALLVSPQGVVMINRALCIGCLACVAVCPSGTMRTVRGGLVPFKCIACDACVKVCPSGALRIEIKEG